MKIINIVDFVFIQTYKNIVIQKKGLNSTVLFYTSYIYTSFIAFIVNIFSLLIDYRIFKNIFYIVLLYAIIFILVYFVYNKNNRKEIVFHKFNSYEKTYLIDFILLLLIFLFFFSIYLNNEYL